MRRTLRGAAGMLLAIGSVVSARPAPAQTPDLRLLSQAAPVRMVPPEKHSAFSEGQVRLEEMKVELALLADSDLFPHYLGAFASGDALELCGFVPNDAIKQQALNLARRTTFLPVRDVMKTQSNPTTPPPQRPAEELQREGTELLAKNLGDSARKMSLTVRPNGVIVVAGAIDSLESKLAVSRLFRDVSGCAGVVNELILQQIVRDGQQVVRVTRDGSMIVPPAALGLKPEETAALPPAPVPPKPGTSMSTTVLPASLVIAATPTPQPQPLPAKTTPAPATPKLLPPPPPTSSLPAVLPPKAPIAPPPPAKRASAGDALSTTELPVKWARPTTTWESQAKLLKGTPKATSAVPVAAAPSPAHEEAKLPTGVPVVSPPAPTPQNKANGASNSPQPRFAETRPQSAPAMTWRRPGGSEVSESKGAGPTKGSIVFESAPAPPAPPALPVLHASRHWPPAYETRPPASSNGKPGVIVFDEEPARTPAPQRVPVSMGATPLPGPAELQRQIKSVCGPQAGEVRVETQMDGQTLVKVKVPSLSVEDQLTRKIFAIPGMTSPKVRLIMDVGP